MMSLERTGSEYKMILAVGEIVLNEIKKSAECYTEEGKVKHANTK